MKKKKPYSDDYSPSADDADVVGVLEEGKEEEKDEDEDEDDIDEDEDEDDDEEEELE